MEIKQNGTLSFLQGVISLGFEVFSTRNDAFSVAALRLLLGALKAIEMSVPLTATVSLTVSVSVTWPSTSKKHTLELTLCSRPS